jgi:hypothetical protein
MDPSLQMYAYQTVQVNSKSCGHMLGAPNTVYTIIWLLH